MIRLIGLCAGLLAVLLVLAACGDGDATTTSEAVQLSGEEAAALEKVALGLIAGAEPLPCSACHTIGKVAFGKVGPDLTNIGTRAHAAYIRESIVDPQAVIVENCPNGPCSPDDGMPTLYAQTLTEEEVDALVWYLMGLTGE
jgi:mono/diheme cytochrome c family protein